MFLKSFELFFIQHGWAALREVDRALPKQNILVTAL
jgi:hypothetical protein